MRTRRILLLTVLLPCILSSAASAADADARRNEGTVTQAGVGPAVEFTGFFRSADGGLKVLITDSGSEKSSAWLAVGGEFKGYTFKEFDSSTEIVALEKGGTVTLLRLVDAKVKGGDLSPLKKVQINISMAADGGMVLSGKAVTPEAFDEMLKEFTASGTPLAIQVKEPTPPTKQSAEQIGRISAVLKKLGAKKWSLSVAD